MKNKGIIITAIISILFSAGMLILIIPWMFKAQYNSKGISHFLVVTIDNSSREYIGTLEGHKVYIEGFDKETTVFRSIDAKNVSIKEALDKKLVSIEEWRKYSFFITNKDDYEVLKYDNYEIVINKKECIIRPLTK